MPEQEFSKSLKESLRLLQSDEYYEEWKKIAPKKQYEDLVETNKKAYQIFNENKESYAKEYSLYNGRERIKR